jgi:hypothetical protein
MGVYINMELSIEKIRYYAVPYMALFKGPRWFFYLLYPNTYDTSFAPGEDYAGRPWYIVPHATQYESARRCPQRKEIERLSIICKSEMCARLARPYVEEVKRNRWIGRLLGRPILNRSAESGLYVELTTASMGICPCLRLDDS